MSGPSQSVHTSWVPQQPLSWDGATPTRELPAQGLTNVGLMCGCQRILLLLSGCQLLDSKRIGSLEQLRERKGHDEVREPVSWRNFKPLWIKFYKLSFRHDAFNKNVLMLCSIPLALQVLHAPMFSLYCSGSTWPSPVPMCWLLTSQVICAWAINMHTNLSFWLFQVWGHCLIKSRQKLNKYTTNDLPHGTECCHLPSVLWLTNTLEIIITYSHFRQENGKFIFILLSLLGKILNTSLN